MQNTITLIVKPTSECNFRCAYCYHKDTGYKKGILSYSLLEKLVQLSLQEYSHVVFVWHGGEPLLCGLPYFEEIIRLQSKLISKRNKIENIIQTNGSLLNDDMISFAKIHKFSICISIDGNLKANTLRQNTELVVENIKKAKASGLNISALGVIHNQNLAYLFDTYNFFKELDIPVKLNPVFATFTDKNDYVMSVSDYVENMKALFTFWVEDEKALLFEPFMQYLSMYFNCAGRDCIYGSCMTKWLGIDSEGNLYPCGRSYPHEYCLGNISEINEVSSVFLSEPYINILKSSIIRRNFCQANCKLFGYCSGGCNNNFILEGNIEKAGGFLCDSFIALFSFIKAYLDTNLTNKHSFKNPYLKKFIKG